MGQPEENKIGDQRFLHGCCWRSLNLFFIFMFFYFAQGPVPAERAGTCLPATALGQSSPVHLSLAGSTPRACGLLWYIL